MWLSKKVKSQVLQNIVYKWYCAMGNLFKEKLIGWIDKNHMYWDEIGVYNWCKVSTLMVEKHTQYFCTTITKTAQS